MFFDRAELFVRSGAGGVGAVSMNGQRPVGGNGGAGGDVVLLCDGSLNTLGHLRGRASVRGDRGDDARGKESGRSAREAIVRVPPNCRVSELESGDAVGELREPGERLLIAAGGQGGEGNGDGYRRTRDSRRNYPPGGSTRARLLLSMTLVADVGLIGHPNAGKSTLLRAATRARPKVADYPFTTLVPNLGVCEGGGGAMLWLDIPGLLEGAHEGRGLGRAFLRHVERCRLLLHLVDGESAEPAAEYLAINRELQLYSPRLAATPQVVLVSKAELPHVAERINETVAAIRAVAPHGRILPFSAHSGLNVQQLMQRTHALLRQVQHQQAQEAEAEAAPHGHGPVTLD